MFEANPRESAADARAEVDELAVLAATRAPGPDILILLAAAVLLGLAGTALSLS
ncbi:MAG: hypothetical protein HOV87_03740 [Catenulispora sp.]|nr:hypothetical protein [Catenulispora sp.]